MRASRLLPVSLVALVGLASVALVAGLVRPHAAGSDDGGLVCPEFGRVEVLGRTGFKEMGLVEASGLVASRKNPGVFWTHNDNTGQNGLFAVDVTGRVLAKFTLQGFSPEQFEDISFGPGGNGGVALYVGDIGDNRNRRDEVRFVRLPEPSVNLNWRGVYRTIESRHVDVYRVAYRKPNTSKTWARDAEAFAIDPLTGDLVIFEKRFFFADGKPRQSWVYEVPAGQLRLNRLNIAKPVTHVTGRVGDVGAGLTAADISADGRWIIAKNMYESFIWPRANGQSVAAAVAAHNVGPCAAPVEKGEAVGFLPDGTGLLMVREGKSTPVWYAPMTVSGEAPRTTAPPAPPTTAPSTTAPPTSLPAPPVTITGGSDDCWGHTATIVGTDGDDELIGTDGDDVIAGLSGDDVIIGLEGDDIICGSAGDDVLRGGPGNDQIYAGGGADTVYGGAGDDILRGHLGNDTMSGDAGRDLVAGNEGDDTLTDGGDAGLIKGGDGVDECFLRSLSVRAWTCEEIISVG